MEFYLESNFIAITLSQVQIKEINPALNLGGHSAVPWDRTPEARIIPQHQPAR